MIRDDRVRELVLSLWKQASARDGQKKVGASDFSDPCDYHLALKLSGNGQGESKYWLGAKLGTAVHEFLEARIPESDLSQFPEFTNPLIEQSIVLGELDGYGTIKSKPDLALVEGKHLIDWKTTKRDKSKQLQDVIYGLAGETKTAKASAYTLKKYFAQTQIYAWGLNKSGVEIDGISLVFINRDGAQDSDLWTWTFPYDEEFAESIWKRLETLWERVRNNEPTESFTRDLECFNCKMEMANNESN